MSARRVQLLENIVFQHDCILNGRNWMKSLDFWREQCSELDREDSAVHLSGLF